MFRLHDKTRRLICLACFCLLCIVPTLATAIWCAMRLLPWAAQTEAERLGNQLGLEVRIDGLKYLRPDVVLYEGFQLADFETGQLLLRCRLLEVQQRKITDQQGHGKPLLVMTASQPEIEISALNQLGALLQRVLHLQTSRPVKDLRIRAEELTLQAGANSHTFHNLEGALDNLPGGVQAMVSFHPAGKDASEPIKIRVVRNRQNVPPVSGFEVHTGGHELICELLALALPEYGAFGPHSRFRGYFWANQDPRGAGPNNWSGELTGQFLGVDLGRLVSDNFPHQLSGTVDLTIQAARFRHGRLEQAAGTIIGGPGVISRSLLEAAVKHLRLLSDADLASLGNQVAYDQLALSLSLDSRGLKIEGRCPSTQRGIILANRQFNLLNEPMSQPQPITGLIQTLTPDSVVLAPAANQTNWLITHLPMPEAAATTTREAALPAPHQRQQKQ